MGRRDNGDGCIYQDKNGKWFAEICIGTKPNGKPYVKKFSGKTEQTVKKKLKEFKKNRGNLFQGLESKKTTLSFYLDHWLKKHKFLQLKEQSYERLVRTINCHIVPEIGYLAFTSITKDDIQNLINKKSETLSYSSVRKIYLALNECYEYNISLPPKERLVDHNPCNNVVIPRSIIKPSKRVESLSREEVLSMEQEVYSTFNNGRKKHHYGDAFVLIVNTGLRMGEALALERNSNIIDLKNRRILVNKTISKVKKRNENGELLEGFALKIFNETKTTQSTRWVSLNDKALQSVKNLLVLPANGDFLIPNKSGDRVSPAMLERSFKSIMKAINVDKSGIHLLRHTFATLLFENGVDVKIISQLLGHSSIKITYDTYVHIIDNQKSKATEYIYNLV